jgi:hypothetical protein
MKIRKIPGTDFRYRLRKLYPNFVFSYIYPDQIDTIESRAPAIVVELKTDAGEEILTLRTDIPFRDQFADVIGMGAAFQFYWEPTVRISDAASSIQDSVGSTIVLAGKERKVIFNFKDSTWSLPMKKDVYYEIPGRSGTGFTVLHICPDINQLKAIPSTKDNEFQNPVAQVEIWRTGEGYREAYLYPASLVRKGGDFQVPGIPVNLSLGIDREYERSFCRAKVSITKGDQGPLLQKELKSAEGISVNSCRLSIHDVDPLRKDELVLEIERLPGRPVILLGSGILFVTIGVLILRRKKSPENEGHEKD